MDSWPCDVAGCRDTAAVAVRTGSDKTPSQVNHLCERHRDEHWEAVRHVVAANVMHYTVLPVGSFDLTTGEDTRDAGR